MDNVLVLKDYKTVSDVVHEYEPTLKFGHIPLVIDNGKCYVDMINKYKKKGLRNNYLYCRFLSMQSRMVNK